jgi:hypothetical protein
MENLKKLAIAVQPVGSRITCNPPVMDTDEDFLLLVKDHRAFRDKAFYVGFYLGGSVLVDASVPLDAVDRFSSYTRRPVNLIVTEDPEFFRKFMLATRIATALNLLDKADRVILFQAILYGNG